MIEVLILNNEVRKVEEHGKKLTLDEMKRQHVATVLHEVGGNKVRAAISLGISRSTLYRLLESRGKSVSSSAAA